VYEHFTGNDLKCVKIYLDKTSECAQLFHISESKRDLIVASARHFELTLQKIRYGRGHYGRFLSKANVVHRLDSASSGRHLCLGTDFQCKHCWNYVLSAASGRSERESDHSK
jgi:hypothetical protein